MGARLRGVVQASGNIGRSKGQGQAGATPLRAGFRAPLPAPACGPRGRPAPLPPARARVVRAHRGA